MWWAKADRILNFSFGPRPFETQEYSIQHISLLISAKEKRKKKKKKQMLKNAQPKKEEEEKKRKIHMSDF